jgi:hypothetical protein
MISWFMQNVVFPKPSCVATNDTHNQVAKGRGTPLQEDIPQHESHYGTTANW